MNSRIISHDSQNETPVSASWSSSLENRLGLEVLQVPGWAEMDWLLHGFSTRRGGFSQIEGTGHSSGDLNLGYSSADAAETVALNRSLFLRQFERPIPAPDDTCGPVPLHLVTLKQMHSSLVRRVTAADSAERASLWGDGLTTNGPGAILGIQTADCLPILMVDRKQRAVGAFHAGWRGTLKGIVALGVASMRAEFGSEAANLTAAIGPGIGSCCFAVGREVRQLFVARFAYAGELFTEGDQLKLDLVEANRRQLLDSGLSSEAIFTLNECTSCNSDRFFSYRAERGKTGRMLSVVGIAPA